MPALLSALINTLYSICRKPDDISGFFYVIRHNFLTIVFRRIPLTDFKLASVAGSKIILYADDDVDDRTWFSEACKAVSKSWNVYFVESGQQVIEYLRSTSSPQPSLIMLDLNMPRMDGRQTLKQIKEDQSFQQIPVVMVTTSINRIDKEVCHRLGASLLITKPDTMSKWQQVIQQLQPLVA